MAETKLTRKEAESALKRADGNKTRAAKAMGVARTTFARILKGTETAADKGANRAEENKKRLRDFRELHDRSYIVPRAIRAAIRSLGSDSWEYETNFIRCDELRAAGVSQVELNLYRDDFADYIAMTKRRDGRRCWAGSTALAEKMNAMVMSQ